MISPYSNSVRTRLQRLLSTSSRKTGPRPSALLPLSVALSAASLLSGCATSTIAINNPTSQSQIQKLVCAPWRPITYSASKDAPDTVDQVRLHDLVGRKLHCWK